MGFRIVETVASEPASEHATEYLVRMRDGVELATDVYLPDGAGVHAAVLVRTPYDKSSRYTALTHEAEFFRARGFAFVAQDVRGKFRSGGRTLPYAYDVADGFDTVEWITRQPWSAGSVGVTGESYYGFTTWAAVASGHPAIKAAVPMVTGIEMGATHVAGRWSQEPPYLSALKDLLQIWTNNDGYLAEIDWGSASIEEIIAEARGQIGECLGATGLLDRAARQDWCNPYGERHPYFTTAVPILHWQNWYDPGLAPAGLRDWRHFRSLGSTRALHYLRVGSADHSGFRLEDVGGGDERNPYLSNTALAEKIATECAEIADFFDEHLNGVRPEQPRPRARWHVGHVGWQTSAEFPPPSEPLTFHLRAGGADGGGHELADAAEVEASVLTWTHDPDDPVPSSVDIEEIWYLLAAYPDERALRDRADVLTFRTQPLGRDVDFAGRPVFEGRLSFSSPSTHLFVKLQDVYPDGTTRPISWGRVVLGTGDVLIELDDNAYRVRAGHRLQLQVQSSDFPHFAVHPGTDESPWTAVERRRTTQGLTVGGAFGARLTLPVVSLPQE
ncbi:MAG TPA: CocE/NonD family hydrolase [Actinospica sp.]|jgi:predicted acyl esterase|nr:CocE/NonD family hydrolase [Actinospica sp.]